MRNVTAIICVLVAMAFAQIPSQGLRCWYPFNGDAVDQITGKALTSMPSPKLISDRDSTVNSAYSFDGNQQYFRGIDSLLPMADSDRSVSFWFSFLGGGGGTNKVTAISYGKRDTTKMFWIYFSRSSSSTSYVIVSNNKDSVISTLPYIPLRTFSHLCIVDSSNIIIVYLNGVELNRGSLKLKTEPYYLGIGGAIGSIYGGGNLLSGYLDDIAIYSRALRPNQVQALYKAKSYLNDVPKTTSTPITEAGIGMTYSYTVTTADTNAGQTLTTMLVQNPTGMTLTGNKISWVPALSQIGSQTVTIKVTDGLDTAVQTYSINVTNPTRIIQSVSAASRLLQRYEIRYLADGKRIEKDKSAGIRLTKTVQIRIAR